MALVLENVTYKNIINNINYRFENGKVYAVLSSNEEEKEILSKVIANLVKNISGKVTSDCSKDKIGYVYKDYDKMFVEGTCYEELSLSLMNNNYSPTTITKKINEVLKMLCLDSRIKDLSPRKLSNGEKKLLSIAISIISNPKILVLNEPTLFLDSNNKKRVIKLLKKIAKRYNKIIIIFTVDILLANELSDNYILINRGSILSEGRTKELTAINDKLLISNIKTPKIMDFINNAYKKKCIHLDKTYDIKELMKDVYRNVK